MDITTSNTHYYLFENDVVYNSDETIANSANSNQFDTFVGDDIPESYYFTTMDNPISVNNKNHNLELLPIAAELTDLFEKNHCRKNKGTQRDEKQPHEEEEEGGDHISTASYKASCVVPVRDFINQYKTKQTRQNYIDILRHKLCSLEQEEEEDLSFLSNSSDAIDTNSSKNNNNAMKSPMVYPRNSNDSWETRFQELQDFYREYGHTIVPHNYTPNKALAQWVKRQRSERKNKLQGQHSTLTDNREHALNSLNFTWDAHESSWEIRWNELLQFKLQNGHCNVPAGFESNKKLATWVKCQRRHFRLWRRNDSGPSSMTIERFNRLNGIGFNWNPRNL